MINPISRPDPLDKIIHKVKNTRQKWGCFVCRLDMICSECCFQITMAAKHLCLVSHYLETDPPAAKICCSIYSHTSRKIYKSLLILTGSHDFIESTREDPHALTLKRVSSLLFTKEYSCFTCCKFLRQLNTKHFFFLSEYGEFSFMKEKKMKPQKQLGHMIFCKIYRHKIYKYFDMELSRTLPFNVLLLASVSEGNADPVNSLSSNAAFPNNFIYQTFDSCRKTKQ